MNKKRYAIAFNAWLSLTLIVLLAFPFQVLAKDKVPAAIPLLRDLDPLGIHKANKRTAFTPEFSFYENLGFSKGSWFRTPVIMTACKGYNAECNINNSGKECCDPWDCIGFNPVSGNGKCGGSCPNGATNPPDCTSCPAGQTMVNGSCVSNCTNGATNPPTCSNCPAGQVMNSSGTCVAACTDPLANNNGQPAPCTYDPCQNGATNPPTCSNCPAGQVMNSSGTCVAACTDPLANNTGQPAPCTYDPCQNGATNPPTCSNCPSGQVMNSSGTCVAACTDPLANNTGQPAPCTYNPCQNGATNPPTCSNCPSGQVLSNGQCVAACADPLANNTGQPAPCTYDPCQNGATNPPTCLNCPAGQVMSNGQCVTACADPLANNFGQALPCTYNPPPPRRLPPLIIPVTGTHDAIAAGIGHSCAVTTDTRLRCWGSNAFGQLGNGNNESSSLPVAVKTINPRTVLSLVAGSYHSCALLTSGEVMCWGLNYSGQLGDGTYLNRNTPVKVSGLKGKIVSLTAGSFFTCAVNDANETMCWGDNSMGQFATDDTGESNIPVLTKLSGIKVLSGAYNELQAVTADGALSFFSKLPAIPVTGLTKDIALVSGNRFDAGGCALNLSGQVECWGSIKGSGVSGAQLTNLLTCGQSHACVQTDKGLQCWGANAFGQLGNGTKDDSESPVLVEGIPSVIGLAAGARHTCVIVNPSTIKCWGSNAFGQLGNGTLVDSQTPIRVK